MEWSSKIKFSDEFKQTVSEQLNQKTMFMNPRTGIVQSLELWRAEKDSESSEPFVETELIEVKLVNEKWVRVNATPAELCLRPDGVRGNVND